MGHGNQHGQYATLDAHNALEIVTAPTETPIALSEVKDQLRIEHSDDDALLTRLIDVAVAFTDAQGALGKAMITQTWAQWVESDPPRIVRLSLGPFQSLDAVRYYDVDGALQNDDVNNYNVFGFAAHATIQPKDGESWPDTQERGDAIQLEFTVGYGDTADDVPATLRHALMLLIGHWYDNREQSGMEELSNIPYGFDALLNMHRDAWYG